MLRAARCGWFVLVVASAGCTKDADYLEVSRQQRAAWKEMTDILAKVKDEKSMPEAKASLEKLSPKFADLARKANALPKPPPPEVLKQFEEDKVIIGATLRHLHTEIERVTKLPGGEEFMKQFQSSSQGLMPAVQR